MDASPPPAKRSRLDAVAAAAAALAAAAAIKVTVAQLPSVAAAADAEAAAHARLQEVIALREGARAVAAAARGVEATAEAAFAAAKAVLDAARTKASAAAEQAADAERRVTEAAASTDAAGRAFERRLAYEELMAERAAAMATGPPADRNRLLPAWSGGLALAEEVLGIPYLSERSILSYLRQDEVLGLRAASRTCREAVAEHAWSDFDAQRSVIYMGRVAHWRKCFPRARAANLRYKSCIKDADFVHLRGLHTLRMIGCENITDAAFMHLRGIHTLDMSYYDQAGITDAAFAHLRGIRTLDMSRCNQATITDAAFAHLRGIHTLHMSSCRQATITDAAFVHLTGISELTFGPNATISNAALAHLRGIRKLHIYGCPQITAAALPQLAGAQITLGDVEDGWDEDLYDDGEDFEGWGEWSDGSG